jgi:glycosyltransferase involved in cell wall biosynthesis
VRYATGRREYPQLTRRLPGLDVLEERYARGEINRDESARYLAQGTSQRSCRAESGTETRYFKERLQTLVDGEQIKLVGELNHGAKGDLLRGASALLFPIDWPEPFGLVMIEAMACGTPVIAYRRGSVAEVVDDGVTGFVVDNEDEAIAAVKRIGQLDRRTVRATFETRFDARRMAKDYLRHYEALLQAETRCALEPVRVMSAG